MVLYMLMLACFSLLPHYDVQASLPHSKRDATGALHIVTNHAQPIHADVKPDGAGTEITDKVTPPENAYYQSKSLRKSLVQLPSKLEVARNIGRVITLAVLLVSAVLEFYPLLQNLYHTIYTFLYL